MVSLGSEPVRKVIVMWRVSLLYQRNTGNHQRHESYKVLGVAN